MVSVERTTTGIIIHKPTTEIKKTVLKYFSLLKPTREYFIYSGNDPNGKAIFGNEKDVIYITSGFSKIKDPVVQMMPKGIRIDPPMPEKIELALDKEPRSKLQRDCIDLLTSSNSAKVTVELKPGTGKAEPYSRKIPTPTPNGYTRMGDLKVGDKVFDKYGNETEILNIFEQGKKEVFKITFSDNRTAYCCKEHLWTVKEPNGVWKTKQLQDLLTDFRSTNYQIPVCCPVNFPEKKINENPWIIGYLLGSWSREDVLSLKREIENQNVRATPVFEEGYFKKILTKTLVSIDNFQSEIPNIVNDVVCKLDDTLKIPNEYKVNSTSIRKDVLSGFIDACGSIKNINGEYKIEVCHSSIDLMMDIKWIVNSLGYSVSDIVTEKKYDSKEYIYKMILGIPEFEFSTFFVAGYHKEVANEIASKVYGYDHEETLFIKNIEFSHVEECRCIMVDNDEHLYLTEDFIVTHNTFIALYAIKKLGYKPLIVVPTTLLKNQWIECFVEAGIDMKDIATHISDAPKKKFCVVTVSAIENELRDNWFGLLNILKEAKFGIKIIDEAHLHLKGVLKFDAICNIKHNWYLSATLGRSDEQEDSILNRALLDAERFVGNSDYEEYQKAYVNVYFQDIWYNPPQKLCNETFKFGSKGLVRSTYYNMLMLYKNGIPFITNIMTMIKRVDSIKTYDGKILVLLPLLETIDAAMQYLKNDPYFRGRTIASVDGSMPLKERYTAMESNIILATSMSMGTGVDVQNLAAVINFDQYSSPIINEQIVGRLRDRGKETWYVDICDHVKQAKSLENWGRKRRNILPYFPGVKPEIKYLPKIIC